MNVLRLIISSLVLLRALSSSCWFLIVLHGGGQTVSVDGPWKWWNSTSIFMTGCRQTRNSWSSRLFLRNFLLFSLFWLTRLPDNNNTRCFLFLLRCLYGSNQLNNQIYSLYNCKFISFPFVIVSTGYLKAVKEKKHYIRCPISGSFLSGLYQHNTTSHNLIAGTTASSKIKRERKKKF